MLLGDAAHTLPATSGQGAGQALEDSVVFSLLLAHYMAKAEAAGGGLTVEEVIKLSIKGLYEIRYPRVATIKARSRNLYLTNKKIDNVVFEYMYYLFIYMWTNFPILGEYITLGPLFDEPFGFCLLTFPGQLIVGTVFMDADERGAGEQVEEYLKKKGQ